MISSPQRTALEIAATVGRSPRCQLTRCKDARGDEQHALATFAHRQSEQFRYLFAHAILF
jgi:hypothetical protein